jgi:DNA-binding MarR family transcriptional regulator
MGKKSKGKDKVRKRDRKKASRLAAAAAAPGAEPAPGTEAGSGAAPGPDLLVAGATETRLPSDIDAMELAARLASLSTVLQRHLSRADTGDGLTRARLSALALLVLGGPRTLGDLANAEHVRPPTMTRLVHAMEADELVARGKNPDDGRSVVIRATAKGVNSLEQGRTRQIAPLAETISGLERSERQQLADAADLLGRVLRDSTWEPASSDG